MNLNIEDIEKNLNNLLSDNKSNPDDPDINHNIGILYGQKGEYDLSATHLQKAIINKPECSEIWVSFIEVLFAFNKLDNVNDVVKEALYKSTNSALIFNTLGRLYYAKGNINAAEENLKLAIEHDPNLIQAFKTLGIIYKNKGEYNNSINYFREILDIEKNNYFAMSMLGENSDLLGNLDDAIIFYKRALELISDDKLKSIILSNLGNVYKKKGLYNESLENHLKCLSIDSENHSFNNNIGSTYVALLKETTGEQKVKNYLQAKNYFIKAIELKKDYLLAYSNLISLIISHNILNDLDEAIDIYDKAVLQNLVSDELYMLRADIFVIQGLFDDARDLYNKALNINPLSNAFVKLLDIDEFEIDKNIVTKIEEHLNKNVLSENNYPQAFGMGKYYELQQKYDDSFNWYKKANDLYLSNEEHKLQMNRYDFVKQHEIIKKNVNKAFIDRPNQFSNKSKKPIFIVGMPRSGTTLVEQILSSHSKVFGAGEINIINEKINTYYKENNFEKENEDLGVIYLDELERIYKNEDIKSYERFCDKLPFNYMNIGIIKKIFPNSKIIHLKRNPIDVCFSIYSLYFVSHPWSYDMDLISKFYQEYQSLMKYWSNSFNDIYELEYEDLVKDNNKEIKKLLEYCELDYEDKCINFVENKRAVNTASNIQVRKKIYATSINRWKDYRKHIPETWKEL